MTKYPSFAAVDLGSNSFHLVVAREVDGRLQLLHKEKHRVYLAAGLDEDFVLSEDAIVRALHVLKQFAATLAGFEKKHVEVAATYTLRSCQNLRHFLKQAKAVFPYKINVISGQEEARLIYQGVSNYVHDDNNRLVVDIGGGSTEVIIGKHQSHKLLTSRDVGCVTMSKLYFQDEKLTEKRFKKAIIHAEQYIEPVTAIYQKTGWRSCLGTSGTIKTLSAINDELFASKVLTLDSLRDIQAHLVSAGELKNVHIKALPDERKASIAGGLAILIAAINQLGIEQLEYCDYSLREGLLHELAQNEEFDIRTRTIDSFAEQYTVDEQHAKHICQTLTQFYNAAKPIWHLEEGDLALLKWAVYLHEVGIAINSSGIHKHSAYIVLNSQLPGFTQEQQQQLGALIRFHRKKIKTQDLNELVDAESKPRFSQLLTLMRLAILFHQKRQKTQVPKHEMHISKHNIALKFDSTWLEEHSLFAADLEQEQHYWKSLDIDLSIDTTMHLI
ncbi:Ppx/GppA family phosphatase [Pseudoalteromonas sp. SMS1]|uniref:Ppx/GppA phosphatase family protein n=1 Tax=Pseudoalteromonas sp. SMS1 TaxID=2908894 RepID=UPI001F362C81|nr:Ppx/GppA phosphatase family protein [Pseudoalteromonas sp. SMS1]MCF2857342.1 Ppx/GppA family phosphatase [Pseudoalteromonas sp. SMS1]